MHKKLSAGKFFGMVQGLLFVVPGVLCSSNYPSSDLNCKPCTKLKNTILIQAPICAVDGGGKFTDEGVKACTETLKQSCPEFNGAECLMYKLSFPDPSSAPRPIPCCRLKYKACVGVKTTATTWMEVYYTLQNGASATGGVNGTTASDVYDIVEVHRKVLEKSAFGQREQADWPASVIDASGERGLHWVTPDYSNLTAPFPKTPMSTSHICLEKNDTRCSQKIVQYLETNYFHGFEDNMTPNITELELTAGFDNMNITIEMKPSCVYIVADNAKTPACQVLYVRRSSYSPRVNGAPKNFVMNTAYVFLEVQVYDPSTDTGAGTVLRYAYWFQEDPIMKESIISNCKI